MTAQTKPTTITVLGATGGIGAAITMAAERRGDLRVRAVNRSGSADAAPGTERVAADVETIDGARTALGGIHATDPADHVVVLAAQPPYHEWGGGRYERLLDNVLTATAEHDGKLVFVDSLYEYDNTAGPINEDSPAATNRKAVLREGLKRRALAAHDRGELRVTDGGFSDYFGPTGGDGPALHQLMLEPALRGKRMRGLYDLDVPHAFAYLPDFAAMFLTLALDDRADGHRWVLPHGPALTQREVQQHVADAIDIDIEPSHGVYGPAMMRIGGMFDPHIREVIAVRDQWEHPWEVDGRRFEATFGPQHVTPLDQALAETVAALQGRSSEVAA